MAYASTSKGPEHDFDTNNDGKIDLKIYDSNNGHQRQVLPGEEVRAGRLLLLIEFPSPASPPRDFGAMPEILEVEAAREVLEHRALDREITSIHAPDAWFLKRGTTADALRHALVGNAFTQ